MMILGQLVCLHIMHVLSLIYTEFGEDQLYIQRTLAMGSLYVYGYRRQQSLLIHVGTKSSLKLDANAILELKLI